MNIYFSNRSLYDPCPVFLGSSGLHDVTKALSQILTGEAGLQGLHLPFDTKSKLEIRNQNRSAFINATGKQIFIRSKC